MAAALGRNCTRYMGKVVRTLNATQGSSTRSLFQIVPSSTRFTVTRSFVSSLPLATSIDVATVDVVSLMVHFGGDTTINDMEDDEGNGRAKHRR